MFHQLDCHGLNSLAVFRLFQPLRWLHRQHFQNHSDHSTSDPFFMLTFSTICSQSSCWLMLGPPKHHCSLPQHQCHSNDFECAWKETLLWHQKRETDALVMWAPSSCFWDANQTLSLSMAFWHLPSACAKMLLSDSGRSQQLLMLSAHWWTVPFQAENKHESCLAFPSSSCGFLVLCGLLDSEKIAKDWSTFSFPNGCCWCCSWHRNQCCQWQNFS